MKNGTASSSSEMTSSSSSSNILPSVQAEGTPEDSEDEACWIPLDSTEEENEQEHSNNENTADVDISEAADHSSLVQKTPLRLQADESATALTKTCNRSSSSSSSVRLERVKRQWETSQKLRQSFVDHPLHQSGRLFCRHLLGEVWNLDLHLRLGMVLILLGTMIQLFVLSLRVYQPQIVVLLLILILSVYYLAHDKLEQQVQHLIKLVVTALDVGDVVNSAQLRRLLLVCLLLPTLLEVRTYGFLTKVVVQNSGGRFNLAVALVMMLWLLYQYKHQHLSPRLCLQQGTFLLYGIAFVLTIMYGDVKSLVRVAGPFLASTGTLLLFYYDQDAVWFSRALRHALRLTLRDVMTHVGDSVRQDEMLQLAMLRWIVDYWASVPPSTAAEPTTATSSTSAQEENQSDPTTSLSSASAQASSTTNSHALVIPPPQREVQWEDLSPMLGMTTAQMLVEVPARPNDLASSSSLPTRPSAPPTNSVRPPQENPSVQSLQSMLEAMDVDDRAGPAVRAYKQAVESFPPSRKTAVWCSIVRRCPASLVLLWRYACASSLAVPSMPILLCFVVLEVLSVLQWSEACQASAETDTQETDNSPTVLTLPPRQMDSMCIILSGDDYSPLRPPVLLQVWENITSSVSALEMGLTAARCAHTTLAAADFAGNVMSLAQLGVEVSQKGWGHGLAILVKELVHLHQDSSSQRSRNADSARYTTAAMGALRNSQIVARNVQALSQDDHAPPLFRNALGVLNVIVGHGWLWGRDHNEVQDMPPLDGDTLRIEELPDETNVDDAVDSNLAFKEKAVPQSKVDDAIDSNSTVEERAVPQPNALQEAIKFTMSKRNDYSEHLELIAEASEKELISENEKNQIMEELVAFRNASDERSLDTMREKLENVLLPPPRAESSSEADRPESASHMPVDKSVSDHKQVQVCKDSTGIKEIVQDNSMDNSENITENCTFQVERDGNGDGSTSDLLDSTQLHVLNEPPRNQSLNANVSDSVVRSPASQVGLDVDQSTRVRNVQTTQAEENNEGDFMKWVGGGLAVVGAVVGGIALANNPGQSDNGRRRETNVTSTVTIEELEDDSQEWVSIGN